MGADPAPTVRVWDRVVRVLHWALVAAVVLSAITAFAPIDAHQPAGYAALAIVLLRVLWGGMGSRHARFTAFVRGPGATWRYVRALLCRHAPRHLGHNPLGAWMVVALIACVSALALTGWLYTTDAFWGSEVVEDLHRACAWLLLGLVVAHVAGVIFTSLRQRENLVAAMWSGRKRAPREYDID